MAVVDDPTVLPALTMNEPDRVLVAGDWHGDDRWAELCCQYAYKEGCDAIIQVGDFGFWTDNQWTQQYLDSVERAAREWDMQIFWVDGNHEDHSRRDEFNDPGERPLTTHLPRGQRWTWWGKRFMALGGAFSVDRFARTEGVTWWSGEVLAQDEIEHASRDDGTPVDVVFAHDCPSGVYIPGVGADWATQHRGNFPDHMLYQASLHRDDVRRVWESTRPGLWVHGHYHRAYEAVHGGTKFVGLDMNGTRLQGATTLLGPESL